jgi:hypothetical protein
VEEALLSSDPAMVCDAILRLAHHEPDWRWVQNICLQLVQTSDPNIRGCAVISLGNIARIHGLLDLEQVIPVLQSLCEDPEVGGKAEDALDDIQVFIS